MERKYNYHAVIQQNYGHGWEDVSEYETTSTGRHLEYHEDRYASGTLVPDKRKPLIKNDLKEYQLTGYPTRVIKRRTKIA